MRAKSITASALLAAILVAKTCTAEDLVFAEDFEIGPSATWIVNGGPSDEAVDFAFDYSSVGIPPAPRANGTTRGLKLQANQSGGLVSGVSVSPAGIHATGYFRVLFDWWANVNGPFPFGGSGSTQLSTFGVGTAGASPQWPGVAPDSVYFAATNDGNQSQDWRAYSSAAPAGYLPDSGVFAAGTASNARNNSHSYYAGFGGVSAPAAQVAAFPQQFGATNVGSAGMQWHQVEIAKTASYVSWTVDELLIAQVSLNDATLGGGNIFFGHADVNNGSSADVNDVHLLFTLIDNVTIVVAEPTSCATGLLGIMAVVFGRRRRASGLATARF